LCVRRQFSGHKRKKGNDHKRQGARSSGVASSQWPS
jgi:hypothetical protein